MTKDSITLIHNFIISEYNRLVALREYLAHQRNQKPEHRVCEQTEDELAIESRAVYSAFLKIEATKQDFENYFSDEIIQSNSTKTTEAN